MFRTSKRVLLILLSFGYVSADGVEYTYLENGADWPDHYPECSGPNQSPIDLRTTGSSQAPRKF